MICLGNKYELSEALRNSYFWYVTQKILGRNLFFEENLNEIFQVYFLLGQSGTFE